MRNKTESLKHLSLTPAFFLDFSPHFLCFHPSVVLGDRKWELLSVHPKYSLLHLCPQGEASSHSSPAPVWDASHGKLFSTNFSSAFPSHRLQFCTNCSSMSLFHGAQSFRTLPCGVTSPVRKRAPVWTPLSTHSQVLPGAYSSTGFSQGHSFFWAATCYGCRGISAPLPVAPALLLLH